MHNKNNIYNKVSRTTLITIYHYKHCLAVKNTIHFCKMKTKAKKFLILSTCLDSMLTHLRFFFFVV